MITSLEELKRGGKVGLARALTRLETAPDAADVTSLLDAAYCAPKGKSLGLTGPPGVGKSTLTNVLIRSFRASGKTVGVIAIDPSSARTQGALLGDRTRIETDPEDTGVFLRSMAARDRLGGVADITYPAMILMRALFDLVVIETVGVGQSEMEVAALADATVFCAQPGSGDALQFMKAGIMEVPDLVLVTKGDMGHVARRAAADIKGALGLTAQSDGVDVLIVSSQSGEGVDEAVAALAQLVPLDLELRRQSAAQKWSQEQIAGAYGRFGLRLKRCDFGNSMAPFGHTAHLLDDLGKKLETFLPSN